MHRTFPGEVKKPGDPVVWVKWLNEKNIINYFIWGLFASTFSQTSKFSKL